MLYVLDFIFEDLIQTKVQNIVRYTINRTHIQSVYTLMLTHQRAGHADDVACRCSRGLAYGDACACASEHTGPSEPAAVCIPMCSSAHKLTNYISIITVRNGSPHGKLVLSTTTSTLKRYAKRIGYLEWRTNISADTLWAGRLELLGGQRTVHALH